ncbi:MAG: hypothetical protein ACN6O9_24290, partial [Agrobacterium tumefaciens]
DTLQNDSEDQRIEAAQVLRTLVEDIILTPVDGKIEIDVRGDLAGILTIAVERKKPQEGASSVSQVKMVAGARLEPALTPRGHWMLISTPRIDASLLSRENMRWRQIYRLNFLLFGLWSKERTTAFQFDNLRPYKVAASTA